MEIHSDRRYRFEHDGAAVWGALTRVEDYGLWWPWLREFDGSSFTEGDRWRCKVKPPLPYSLTFHITLVEVVDGHAVSAQLDGDIVGIAHLQIDDLDRGCELVLDSALTATGGPGKFLARFARPVASFGHDWVLDTGARQFRRIALSTPGSTRPES